MSPALMHQELRENTWIAAIGLAALLYLVAYHTGWTDALPRYLRVIPGLQSYGYADPLAVIPFVHSGFQYSFTFLCAAVAIAIGLRQTLGEQLYGTYPLLLRLPISRGKVFCTKLIIGLGLYLGCAAVPIVLYASWAATPGTHASPFRWSMTLPVWMSWLSVTLLYLSAFLAGIRPARWIGSRLLPLAAGVVPVFILYLVVPISSWWIAPLVIVVLDAVLVICILDAAAARDYS